MEILLILSNLTRFSSEPALAVSQLVHRLETIIVETPNNQVVDMESADGYSESVSEIAGVAESMVDFITKRRSSQFLVTTTE